MDKQTLIDFLLDPATYPEKPRSVRLVQTHISWVFIGDEYVYKVKKPVDFGFLDFPPLRSGSSTPRKSSGSTAASRPRSTWVCSRSPWKMGRPGSATIPTRWSTS